MSRHDIISSCVQKYIVNGGVELKKDRCQVADVSAFTRFESPVLMTSSPASEAIGPSDCLAGCTILEELDYLCNLIGLRVLPLATSTDKDTSRTLIEKNQSGRKRREHLSEATTCKTIPFFPFPVSVVFLP